MRTVEDYYKFIDEQTDKEGMPYFERDDLLTRFTMATYDFLDQNKDFIQINQKAKEDLGLLTKPFSISNFTDGLLKFSTDFYGLVSIRAFFQNKSYPLKIVQSNDVDKLKDDPFHTPIETEPIAQFYNNGVLVEPTPQKVEGLYLKQPTIGTDDSDELAIEIPIQIRFFIARKVVLNLMTTTGDPRFQMQYYQVAPQSAGQ